ncbi:MAG: lipid-A-disaccharide synthase [Bacteroidetes bacterium]|nr:lipid-A-disaccharide synthase [Bacteroidota bacterium]
MKYYIIAGEASGDLHGSNLLRELKVLDKQAEFRGWGGDLMQAQGAALVKHYRDLAFMGFVEVLANLRTILKNIDFCKSDLLQARPDVLILIDYPGFNLRIAEFAKAQGIRVFYYISPQIWAWKQSRVHKIKRFVERMFVILPFEKDFYAKFDYPVDFVGHPLLDAIANSNNTALAAEIKTDKPIVALLPGSRKQEVLQSLPVMLKMIAKFPTAHFVLAAAPSLHPEFYKTLTQGYSVQLVQNNTYGVLQQAKAALVTSGTATLETALFQVPEVVCYKGSKVSYWIARQLVKVKYISLVNLIMDSLVVTELIQNDFTEERLETELKNLLENEVYLAQLKANYNSLIVKLGGSGASAKTATLMFQYLTEKK